MVVGPNPDLRTEIIKLWHSSSQGRHSGIDNTYRRIAALFYWKSLKDDVTSFVKKCDTCKKSKYDTSAYPGILQPLQVLSTSWSSISMDFIDDLPKSKGRSVIWVVVYRLTKYAHFIPLSHPYTASDLAKLFVEFIFKLHGMPDDIVSDKDPIFTSNF